MFVMIKRDVNVIIVDGGVPLSLLGFAKEGQSR